MFTKTFDDGSTYGPKELATSVALGAVLALAITGAMAALDNWKTRRWNNKYNKD